MDAAAAPPPDLLTVAAPQSRGPPGASRPPGQRDPGGSPAVAAFDLLLQMLGTGLPAGQSLPVGGSGLPASAGAPGAAMAPGTATAAGACAGAAAPATVQGAGGAQSSAATLADWLRLALGGPGGDSTVPDATDASSAAAAAAKTGTPASAGPLPAALDPASASADSAPIDLQALLGGNADSQAQSQSQAQPLAALMTAPSERAAATDAQRRTQPSITPADGSTQVASDLQPADPSALHAADTPMLAALTQIPATVEKTTRLGDDALPLAVTPTTGVDAASATALPLVHASGGAHATAASDAPAQAALPQSSGDAIDTTAARWHDALATRIQWLVDHDVGEAKIKLNPPELGALDVKIALQDDKTYVQMVAHNANARDELAQGLPRLRELLSAGGLELGGATVSGGHDDRGAFGAPSPQPIARVAAFASAADDAHAGAPRARLVAGSAVIDTFA
jgi:flagellar hook-length control protein FliK